MSRNEVVSRSNRGRNIVVAERGQPIPRNRTKTAAGSAFCVVTRADHENEHAQDESDVVRTAVLAQKQFELDKTIDKHDDMVRELFQMENFKNMLLYDPNVAKEDTTVVFKEYKSKFDLVENATPIAGPSRRTRGQVNEQRQIITSNALSMPPRVSQPSKRAKSKVVDRPELENILSTVSRGYKGKGKEKEKEKEVPPQPLADRVQHEEESVSTIFVRQKRSPAARISSVYSASQVIESISASPKVNGKNRTSGLKRPAPVPIDILERTEKLSLVPQSEVLRPLSSAPTPVESISTTKRHETRKPTLSPTMLKSPISTAHASPQRKENISSHAPEIMKATGIRADPSERFEQSPLLTSSQTTLPPPVTPPVTPSPYKATSTPRQNRWLGELPQPTLSPIKLKSIPPATTIPNFSQIKRVKLIVRRPLPTLTDPRQRPPPPKFNNSLHAFLNSYTCIDDAEPFADSCELTKRAKEEAAIRERVEQFRIAGRFIPGTEVLFGTTPPDTPYTPPQRTSKDIWDCIVEEVVAKAKTRSKKPVGPTVAAQVASRVQSHFATKESRRTKARDVEERRLRNLAKSTMKMVIAEWKKAVYHIREKRRLQLEEEERREGRAHLASILDQSGQILETQHEDLSRGDMYGSRSRSGSIGGFDNVDSDDDDGDEETEEETDSDGDRDGDEFQRTTHSVHSADDGQDSNDEEEDENGTSLLLAGDSSNLFRPETTLRSSVSTPLSTPEELEAQEDAEATGTSRFDVTRSALDDLLMYADSDSEMDMETSELVSSPLRVVAPVNDLPSSPVPLQGADSITEKVVLDFNDISHQSESEIQDPDLDVNPSVDLPSPISRSWSREVRFVEAEPAMLEGSVDVDQGYPFEAIGDSSHTSVQINEEGEDQDVEDELQHTNEEQNERDNATHEAGENDLDSRIPEYLKPFAVAPVEWDLEAKITPPLLLRGSLRPYQQSGLEWLASLHTNKLNGILADEMGLGKTIQTISLLAHLACDRGIWGPHLIIVPTSVLLNWEMEFKKFLPGFKVLSYHGSTKRRKDLRHGWNDKHQFNVCITSYTLASRDAHIFKRKAWYYMVLDEAHMIKNFKSQRWNILLMFRSYRRLLLTGTPLQNNLTELWALLQFLMSGANFANLKEFGEWFSNPLEKAIESGNAHDEDTMQTVTKLHTVLRPYLLRRLKRDVEKELPSKFEHLTMCPLSKRQRFLYDEFMDRAQTRDALQSGVYQKVANILMQLRKVCNHPDLFEVRPIVTSFVISRSAIADFEIKELLVRRRLLSDEDAIDLNAVGLNFINRQNVSLLSAVSTRYLDATPKLPHLTETAGEPPPKDTRTIDGYRKYAAYTKRMNQFARWSYIGHLNKLRCNQIPIVSAEMLSVVRRMSTSIVPLSNLGLRQNYLECVNRINAAVKSFATRAQELAPIISRFTFVTPPVVALDLPRQVLAGHEDIARQQSLDFDEILHPVSVKLQIAFPDPSLLQWDCGKLQRLAELLREKKAGGHRILIFTQMTRILDVLETFLNFHGYLYLRLDGATKIEDRQYITERFNADPRIFCFIASSRSGGVGINLTGADTVVFYDSDFNPQMDRQCEDRAHRIGQIRDVHIYRFVSQHTVEEAMLLKAEQKRSLDELVIQRGAFDWQALLNDTSGGALARALGEYEDAEDRHAAAVAAREEFSLVGQDAADFADGEVSGTTELIAEGIDRDVEDPNDGDEQGGSVAEYMLALVESNYAYFRDWRL